MTVPRGLFYRAVAMALLAALTSPAAGGELKSNTVQAFERYTQLTEERINRELRDGKPFLWVDGLPEPHRNTFYAKLRQGEIVMDRLETRENGKEIAVPEGLIHHCVGIVFISGATLEQTVALLQDYNHHYEIYKPEVVRSKLLRRDGNGFRVYMRFHKKKVITVELNTEHDARYFPIDATHLHSRSYSTRIAEVENPGQANEHERPVGNDHGLLWRLNSYWRLQEKAGGVYVQCEAFSLTRKVPAGLGWLLGPFITGVPKESLYNTLSNTRAGVRNRAASLVRDEPGLLARYR
jgi:hypothetical protein